MATNVQFPIAVHLMAGLGFRCSEGTTSAMLATSINTSPSFIRRTLAKLAKAGLVETTKGCSGCCRLARDASKISLLDIYKAVSPPKAFSIHDYGTKKSCPVSCNIKSVLETTLDKTQRAMERSLAETKLSELVESLKK